MFVTFVMFLVAWLLQLHATATESQLPYVEIHLVLLHKDKNNAFSPSFLKLYVYTIVRQMNYHVALGATARWSGRSMALMGADRSTWSPRHGRHTALLPRAC